MAKLFLGFFAFVALASSSIALVRAGEDLSALTLESIFLDEAHDGPTAPSFVWIEGGAGLAVRQPAPADPEAKTLQGWDRIDAITGERSEWLAGDILPSVESPDSTLEIDGIVAGPDGRWLLLQTDRAKRWRHTHTDRHWVHDRETGRSHRLGDPEPQIHARFSPDGSQIGFVAAGNLYVVSTEGGTPRPLTDDGSELIFNGDPDWVYEEELDFDEAWWWAPDGRSIAFLRFDASALGTYPLTYYHDGSYPEQKPLPYAKAGHPNSDVRLGLVDVETGEIRWIASVSSDEGYLARVDWSSDADTLTFQRLDRAQRRLELLRYDVSTGRTTPLLVENREAWIEVDHDLRFVPGGLLWTSDRDGYEHLYFHALDGSAGRPLTAGEWNVLRVLGVDESTREVVVQTDRGDHRRRKIERISYEDGRSRPLSALEGWNEADVAPDGQRWVHTHSDLHQRPRDWLRDREGATIAILREDGMEDLDPLDPQQQRFLTLATENGLELHGRLFVPRHFDAARRYPVLVYCYGGPGSQIVTDRWRGTRGLFHRLLTAEGILVFLVDGRGTGGRGLGFRDEVYLRLGQLESEDQIAAARWLAEQPFVDPARIAIYGWSYGGYLSAMSLLRGEGVFAGAISGAPVTDWRFYDTIYTERYMGTPDANPEGYAEGSLLPLADRLQGELLLVHGGADDNVHLQNTMELAAALQAAGKPFELMVYPNQHHGVRGTQTRHHLYSTMRGFLRELFELDRPEGP